MSTALESFMMFDTSLGRNALGLERPLYHELDDAGIVSRVCAGDMAAFEELVRRYRNDVFSLSMHFVRSREDAWDISQEVFIKAHRSLAGFRGEASLRTWLLRITANQCKDFLKKRRLSTVPLDETMETLPSADVRPGPDRQVEAEEVGKAIKDALDALPFKHRSAFILRELEGLSYQEMAEAMGCNIGTVMSRLHHARKKIRDGLTERGIVLGRT